MQKYKLKKDSFFYKAGTVCKLTPKGNMILGDNQGTCVLHKHQLDSHPGLLDEWFEKIEEEKKYGGRVPKWGDRYCYLSDDGVIEFQTWVDTFFDKNRFESGSAFWTREEAEKELKRRKAYVILKEDTKGFVPDWKDARSFKFNVHYAHRSKVLVPEAWTLAQPLPELFFATKEDAQASIEAHHQLWLDYLGIEEEER